VAHLLGEIAHVIFPSRVLKALCYTIRPSQLILLRLGVDEALELLDQSLVLATVVGGDVVGLLEFQGQVLDLLVLMLNDFGVGHATRSAVHYFFPFLGRLFHTAIAALSVVNQIPPPSPPPH